MERIIGTLLRGNLEFKEKKLNNEIEFRNYKLKGGFSWGEVGKIVFYRYENGKLNSEFEEMRVEKFDEAEFVIYSRMVRKYYSRRSLETYLLWGKVKRHNEYYRNKE